MGGACDWAIIIYNDASEADVSALCESTPVKDRKVFCAVFRGINRLRKLGKIPDRKVRIKGDSILHNDIKNVARITGNSSKGTFLTIPKSVL